MLLERNGTNEHQSTFNHNSLLPMRFIILSIAILFAGCNGSETNQANSPGEAEVPTGIQEKFDDAPGLIRVEIVNAAGRLATVGYWLNGKKEGTWADYTDDDRVFRLTTYVNGKMEGVYMEFTQDNRVAKRIYYHNGQRHGKYVEYIQTRVKEERFYSNGKLEGVARVFFTDGKLMEEGYYENGLREGISKWYDREGNLTLEYEYHKGELVKK
jgi:antitoxin component YwqK of YwqJK toxin-antitoxin module